MCIFVQRLASRLLKDNGEPSFISPPFLQGWPMVASDRGPSSSFKKACEKGVSVSTGATPMPQSESVKPSASMPSAGVERRVMSRRSCFIPVDYTVQKRFYRDFIHNISKSGAFIKSIHPLDIGTQIDMAFAWVGSQKPVRARATIVHKGNQGFGVRFTPLVKV
jgi:hypothetical protein